MSQHIPWCYLYLCKFSQTHTQTNNHNKSRNVLRCTRTPTYTHTNTDSITRIRTKFGERVRKRARTRCTISNFISLFSRCGRDKSQPKLLSSTHKLLHFLHNVTIMSRNGTKTNFFLEKKNNLQQQKQTEKKIVRENRNLQTKSFFFRTLFLS